MEDIPSLAAPEPKRISNALPPTITLATPCCVRVIADITRIFNELDATATAVSSVELPIRLTGRSGALIKEVYLASSKKAGVFDKIVKDLEVSLWLNT